MKPSGRHDAFSMFSSTSPASSSILAGGGAARGGSGTGRDGGGESGSRGLTSAWVAAGVLRAPCWAAHSHYGVLRAPPRTAAGRAAFWEL